MNPVELEKVVKRTRTLSDETDNDIISAYAEMAHDKLMSHLYPFGGTDDLPDRFTSIWVEATMYLLFKRGAEHETTHTENGITRIYEDADLPHGILRKLVPVAVKLS